MSAEVPKPVEAPVVPPTSVESPFATENSTVAPADPVAESTTDTPAIADPVVDREVAPKEEVKPVEEGVLGYKGPGLLKSFIFQKKFFWFGTHAIEHKSLSSYLRGEKDAASANHNAAWASHTGKGLLFFSKKATDKATPAGLFNLSEVADITEEGTDFHFLSGGHKHIFQATSTAERENWVAVLKAKVEEAKALGGTIKDTEEYKKAHTSLSPPAVVPVAAAKKAEDPKVDTPAEAAKEEKKEIKEEKKEEKKEIKEEKKEEKREIKEEKKEEKKDRKSRSASRKRTSIFGGFGNNKKKEEEGVVSPTVDEPVAAAEAPIEPTPIATENAPVVAEPVVPVTAVEEPTTATETATTKPTIATETATTKPTPTKRNSIFGTLKSQFSHTKEKKSTEAPVVPAKDEVDPVSETAPVIPQVESTEPLAATATPEVAPVEATAPVTNGETKAVETPVTKADKRKSSLPWLSKKEKPASDEESDKPKSPFAKLRATVKGKKPEKTTEAKPEEIKKDEEEAIPAAAVAPATEEPVVGAPVPAVTATNPQVTASA